MPAVSNQQLAVYAAAAIAIALIGARYLNETADPHPRTNGGRAARLPIERSESRVFVHVTGAVREPGVYRLPSWARLDLAVKRAGGAIRGANLEGVNLAARLSDGQQVVVPERVESGSPTGPAGADAQSGAPVSLNTATAEQLDQLEGVGPATAKKILEWRQEHGGFGSVDDLKQISGIGPKRFAALKDNVRM
jgi:competence protein ComEA